MLIEKVSDDRDQARAAMGRPLCLLLLGGILASLAAQAWLAFVQQFNGDEFHFISHIYEYRRGTLDAALQTFHVHLLGPLVDLPGTEIDRVIAGRLVMLVLEAGTLALLYLLARTWAGRAPSLLAVLAFAAMPLTIEHSASFRADPLALALVMASLTLLARSPLRPAGMAGAGLLAALAVLVTIKVVLFAPAFAGIALWRIADSPDRRQAIVAMAMVAATALLSAAVLFLLHQSSLQGPDLQSSGRHLAGAGSVSLFGAGLFPNSAVMMTAAVSAPLQSILLVAAGVGLTMRAVSARGPERFQCIALLCCVVPLASLAFYRNSFPYFIPFISAPAFVTIAWYAEKERWDRGILAILAAGMLVSGAIGLSRLPEKRLDSQRAVVDAVHEIFPQPVPYIDRSGLIGTFPRQGFLMTTWGMQSYKGWGPIFEGRLRSRPTPLLIVNGPVLEEALGLRDPLPAHQALDPVDRRTLQENYVPHWGRIWVAGKQLRLDGSEERLPMTILIPGTYTVEGGPVRLEGRLLRPGETVELDRRTYRLSAIAPGTVTFRWGDNLRRPERDPPADPPYSGF